MEFATIWNSYGVDVTIVEMLPRVVPLEDEEVSKELEKEFKKRGIQRSLAVPQLRQHEAALQKANQDLELRVGERTIRSIAATLPW